MLILKPWTPDKNKLANLFLKIFWPFMNSFKSVCVKKNVTFLLNASERELTIFFSVFFRISNLFFINLMPFNIFIKICFIFDDELKTIEYSGFF